MSIRTQAPETRIIRNLDFPHVQPVTTATGNRIYLSPRRELGVLKLELYWPAGTAHQKTRFLARTANTLRLNGTDTLSAEQVMEGFEFLGASVSADTGQLASTLSLKVRTEAYAEALAWLFRVLHEASFPESELDNYKQVEAASLLRRMQTPRYWSSRTCLETLYGKDSPDTSFSDPADIAALERNMLPDWSNTWLKCGDALIFLSGDAGEKELNLTAELMAMQARGAGLVPEIPNVPYSAGAANNVIRKPVEHSNQVSMYWARSLDAFSPHELQTASLLNMFLGGFFGSRLMQELREEKGLTYGIGSSISQASRGNTWMISGEMNSMHADAAVEATREILNSLISNPPAGEELDKAKRYYAGQLRSGFDGPFSMPRKIQFLMQQGFDYNYYDTVLDHLWSISTEELCEMADNLLQPDSFTIALAGDVKP